MNLSNLAAAVQYAENRKALNNAIDCAEPSAKVTFTIHHGSRGGQVHITLDARSAAELKTIFIHEANKVHDCLEGFGINIDV